MKQKTKSFSRQGFTLVELLIVIAIVGVVGGIVLSTLAATLRSSTKTTVFNQVKQNGDLAIEIMTRSIQSAVDICTRDGPDADNSPDELLLYTTTASVNCTSPPNAKRSRFRCIEGTGSTNGEITKIEEDVDAGGNLVVTSQGPITSGVKVKENSCLFVASTTRPKRAAIDFVLNQDVSLGSTAETSAEAPFHTEVTLRNF